MSKIKELLPQAVNERICTLNEGYELSLGIEDRFTNLIIWIGKSNQTIYMCLDKANNYSVPLNIDTIGHLKKPNKIIENLLKFGFKSDIKHLKEIIDITKDLPIRQDIAC
jgi:hypothetical protein